MTSAQRGSVGVDVAVADGVDVGVSVGVQVGVSIGVLVGVGVYVGVGVGVGVKVGVGVEVEVGVVVGVKVGVSVGVRVAVAVEVGVMVGVGVEVEMKAITSFVSSAQPPRPIEIKVTVVTTAIRSKTSHFTKSTSCEPYMGDRLGLSTWLDYTKHLQPNQSPVGFSAGLATV
jgi:hypothetical protein